MRALALLLLAPLALRAALPPPPPPAAQAAAKAITPELLRGHIRFLADDLLEGRGTGSKGEAIAARYIAAQLEALGLEPAGDGGGWLQRFTITGVRTHAPATTSFEAGESSLALAHMEDTVLTVANARPEVRLAGAEVVFVGYGIVAPEYRWDDYKGTDVKGKVLLVMNDDPSSDPTLFAGKARLYYGRWGYKYEEAARHGAAAVILVHTDRSAGYGWKVVRTSWGEENFELPPPAGTPRLAIQAWATEDAARRIAALGGKELDALRRSAESREFRPVPLGVRWNVAARADVREVVVENVLGKLAGSDPARAGEAVLFTAHHDHLGTHPARGEGGDHVFNGAVDNASGVAGILAVARAMTALPERPARTLFFAAVTGEEQGLLGSRHLAQHPPVPAGRLAAVVNLDAMNVLDRTRDVAVVGLGKSDADDHVQAAAAFQGRTVKGDPFPDQGFFYRSDQFSFVQIGVPAVYLKGGVDYVGKPEGWGMARLQRYVAVDYHQPSDEMRPEFSLLGTTEDAQLVFYVGLSLANAGRMPAWRPGDEFEAARKKALQAR